MCRNHVGNRMMVLLVSDVSATLVGSGDLSLASGLCVMLDPSLTIAPPQRDVVVIFVNIELMSSTLGRISGDAWSCVGSVWPSHVLCWLFLHQRR
jgi:hypothetical protein